MKLCVVFTCNKTYLDKFKNTYKQLITIGKYHGDVTLVIGNDLNKDKLKSETFFTNINIIQFNDINFNDEFMKSFNELERNKGWRKKIFQYHKLHLFNVYFKQWDYIFYMDCGITIYKDISPILELCEKNTILAHSDAYHTYVWRLHDQFDKTHTLFNTLNEECDLNVDYFQTTIMLYDTNIIDETTFDKLYSLTNKYPISITNDQGIIALYFTNFDKKWKQIKTKDENTFYYDYLQRIDLMKKYNINNYIMLKSKP